MRPGDHQCRGALSVSVISHQDIQLADSSPLKQPTSMKISNSNYSNGNPHLLFLVPVICSMAFAACSDVASTPETHQTVNLQSAVIGHAGTGDNVTIGQRS